MLDYSKLGRQRYNRFKTRDKTGVILEMRVHRRYGVYDDPNAYMEIPLDAQNNLSQKKFDFKKEANLFVRRMATTNALARVLSKKELLVARKHGRLPDKLIVDFKVPPTLGGSLDAGNFYITTPDVNEMMYALYWRHILQETQTQQEQGKQVMLHMPCLSNVFGHLELIKLLPAEEHRSIKEYLASKVRFREKALENVVVHANKYQIVLQLKHPKELPLGMKRAFIKTENLDNFERAQLRAEYVTSRRELARQSLERGDFDHLPPKIKECILEKGHIPAEADLTCHHIIPRSVGGKNELDNVVWLSVKDHVDVHQKHINPLVVYYDSLIGEKRPVYMEIPVPTDTLLPTYETNKHRVMVKKEPIKPVPVPQKKTVNVVKKTHSFGAKR